MVEYTKSMQDSIKDNAPKWARDEILKGNDDPALSVYLKEAEE